MLSKKKLYSDELDSYINDLYNTYYENEKIINHTQKRKNNIELLKKFLHSKHEYTTEELVLKTSFNSRKIERYMDDINYLYKNIGYDYKTKKWYII